VKDYNATRLERITARYDAHRALKTQGAEPDRGAFLERFERVRRGVLEPLVAEIGVALKVSGHEIKADESLVAGGDRLAFAVRMRGVPQEPENAIVLFVARCAEGFEIIAELVIRGTPIELRRFEAPEKITGDVAEQMFVDALEHLFACSA
jgi:hypothetical protein